VPALWTLLIRRKIQNSKQCRGSKLIQRKAWWGYPIKTRGMLRNAKFVCNGLICDRLWRTSYHLYAFCMSSINLCFKWVSLTFSDLLAFRKWSMVLWIAFPLSFSDTLHSSCNDCRRKKRCFRRISYKWTECIFYCLQKRLDSTQVWSMERALA